MITIADLEVTLAGRRLLGGVEFTARPGEITAIVGPNGSGKTTLLRAITGEIPFRGRILLDGEDMARIPRRDLALRRAVLPQSGRLAFPFTLGEVVAMGLSAGAVAYCPDVAEAALAAVDLAGRGRARFNTLSGGEQSRGHFARALAQVWEPVRDGRANWLLLDEPVASLDIGHQLLVMHRLARYAEAGGGAIAVMHDINLTAMFARHVVLVADRGIVRAGPPTQVLTDPLLESAYRARVRTNRLPDAGQLFLLPQATLQSGPARANTGMRCDSFVD